MKRISAKEGGPTDMSRDHELTDWARVDTFTRDFAERVGYCFQNHMSAVPAVATPIEPSAQLR